MIRALGLVFGGACLASFAALAIAASPSADVTGSPAAHLVAGSGGAAVNGVRIAPAAVPGIGIASPSRVGVSDFVQTPRKSGGRLSRLSANAPSIAAQTVNSVTPNTGASGSGGVQGIVINGSGFTGATDVHFGATDVTSTSYPCLASTTGCFTIVSDTEIDADTPVETAGTVDVIVGAGTANPPSDQYSYFDPPTVASVASPQPQGATGIAVTGTNFSYPGVTPTTNGVTEVDLVPTGGGSTVHLTAVCTSGSQPDCFAFTDDSDLSINLPASMTAGSYDTQVTTPGGTSQTSANDVLVVNAAPPPPPTLTSLSPTSGSTAGGNDVVLAGTNFTGATDVNFGPNDLKLCGSGSCFSVDNDSQITVHSVPGHGAGSVSVTVTTGGGTSGSQSYAYTTPPPPPPTLTNLNPSSGSTAGGNSVTLNGTNFTGATDVNVGSHDLTSCPSAPCFTVNSDTQIAVTMPPNVPGTVSVDVVTPGGTTSTLPYTFVVATPTVTGVSPNAGAPGGGNTITLTGTDFEAAGTSITSTVTVGGTAITATPCVTSPIAPCFTVKSATSITVQVLPPGSGMVHITVTTSGGTSTPTSADIYTYVTAFPAVTQVLPKEGATGGGEFVEIFGTNFGSPSTGFAVTDVWFGSHDEHPCAGSTNGCFVQVGFGQLDAYTPSASSGTVDVKVTTPGGTTNPAPPADQYAFVPPGAYTALTPFRICDTRSTSTAPQCRNSTLGPHGSVAVHMLGGQIPLPTQAVVVNITAINRSSTPTFVTAYPTGTSVPLASNINLAGSTVEANLVIVQLGAGGGISIFNSVGSADVIVDVEGYFAPPSGSSAGAFHSIPPLRICDSRGGAGTECAGATSIPLQAGKWRAVKLSGLPPNVPPGTPSIPTSGAAAAVFNLTATGGTQPTYLSVTPATTGANPCPTKAPLFSNLNPSAGISLPNRVISNLGPNQEVCIFSAAGSINFIVDVNGWFGTSSAPAGALFYSVPPTRICDTRAGTGTRCSSPTPLTAGASKTIAVAGVVVVPAENAHSTQPVAVVANLTGIAGTAPTYFTLYPADIAPAAKPRASDLNPGSGQVIANLAIVKLATTTNNGDVNLYNAVGSINAILDVAGWFQ